MCYSASLLIGVGSDANRRVKLLICLAVEGCAESDRGRVRGRQLELLFGTDPNRSVVRLANSELLDLKPALLEPACHCPAVQHSKRLVRVSLIANTGRTTSYKALQNSKIMIK